MNTTTDLWQFRESAAFAAKGVDLGGFTVEGRDGPLGRVDRASNDLRVDYLVVEGGDWLSRRRVLVPAGTVERVDHLERTVHVDRTRDQIKNSPEYDPATFHTAEYRDQVGAYYTQTYREPRDR